MKTSFILFALWSSLATATWDSRKVLLSKNHTLRINLGSARAYRGLVMLKRTDDELARYFYAEFSDAGQMKPTSLESLEFSKRYTEFRSWFEKMVGIYPTDGHCQTKLAIRVSVEKREVHAASFCYDLVAEEDAKFLSRWLSDFNNELGALKKKNGTKHFK